MQHSYVIFYLLNIDETSMKKTLTHKSMILMRVPYDLNRKL